MNKIEKRNNKMGRKKIDKTSIEYLANHLFHKDSITGFQFTAGNTPLGIKENRILTMYCSLNKSRDNGHVIDCSESELKEKIAIEIFKEEEKEISMEQLRDFQKQFKELGYEVEECEFVGQWYWFRVHCKPEEIPFHVERLKSNLKIK